MYGGFESGIVATMVYTMKPYIAIPNERILQIGQPDPSLFIFQSGRAHTIDGCGDEEFISTGAILSNVEFKQVAKRVGVPTKQLMLKIYAAKDLPRQGWRENTNPYIETLVISQTVFGESRKKCVTTVRKFTTSPRYNETFSLKVYQNTENAAVSVFHWRRGVAGSKIGTVEVAVKDEANSRPRWHTIKDESDKAVGKVKLAVTFGNLERKSIAKTAEVRARSHRSPRPRLARGSPASPVGERRVRARATALRDRHTTATQPRNRSHLSALSRSLRPPAAIATTDR